MHQSDLELVVLNQLALARISCFSCKSNQTEISLGQQCSIAVMYMYILYVFHPRTYIIHQISLCADTANPPRFLNISASESKFQNYTKTAITVIGSENRLLAYEETCRGFFCQPLDIVIQAIWLSDRFRN